MGERPRPTIEQLERYAAELPVDDEVRLAIEEDTDLQREVRGIQRDNTFLSEFVGANAALIRNNSSWLPGDELPGYAIERELSRGGQGVVFEATQITTKRRVAVKMLLQGTFATSRQRHRFEREVELVSRLRHPAIVTVYESGRTLGGAHFLAMEFIDGVALNEHANELRAKATSPRDATRQAMELCVRICEGMTSAHRRGIMHRDLKPGNILVGDDGQPHILDFGLAKAVREETIHRSVATQGGEFMGTFAYAAPEQLKADPSLLDVRTDVYAIGALLYEMVTGIRAHDVGGSISEVIRRLQEESPPPPSLHVPGLDADVQTIIQTAMAKDPERRYQSADLMRMDIERWMNHEPIAARRDSTWYVLRKMVRRRRVPIAVAGAFLFVTIGLSALYTWRLTDEIRNLRRVKAIFDEAIDPKSLQDDNEKFPSPTEWLTRLALLANMDMPDDPEFEARIRTVAGLAYLDKPDFEAAREQFTMALSIYERAQPGAHSNAALAHHNLGRALWFLGTYEEAERSYRTALAMRQQLYEGDHKDIARTMSHIGACLRRQGRFRDAELMYRQSLEMRIALYGEDHKDVFNSRNSLALCLSGMGRSEEAAESFRAVLPFVRNEFGDENFRTARTMHNLAKCLVDMESFDEAGTLLTEALRIKKAFWGKVAHNDVALTMGELARLQWRRGDAGDAKVTARDAISMQWAIYGDEGHADLATSWRILGVALMELGDVEAAGPALRTALDMRRRMLDERAWQIAEIESDLAALLIKLNRPEDALELLEGREATYAAHLPAAHRGRRLVLERLLATYALLGRSEDIAATQLLLDAID